MATSPNSLWSAIVPAREPQPSMSGDLSVDIVIIGGGYSGLSAALYLAERNVSAAVLEAEFIGWGASGRNGGVVSAKYRIPYPVMAKQHGLEITRRMYQIAEESMDLVESLTNQYQITDARFVRSGSVKCAHNKEHFADLVEDAEWQNKYLGNANITVLSKSNIATETGSSAFTGGANHTNFGHVQPLSYVHGLAAAITTKKSVHLFERTLVISINESADGVMVSTPTGHVKAKQLIIATNAYSSVSTATRNICKMIIPFRTAIISTETLTSAMRSTLLVHERSYTETRRMMRWFRLADGHFLFGGRGAFRLEDSDGAFEALQSAMVSLFPQLKGIPVTHRWSGHVAMTLDKLPHVGRLTNRIVCTLGYNGAGVAMSTLMGRFAARIALGDVPDLALLAVEHLRRIPLYPLREIGIRSLVGWYQLLDKLGR